MGFLSRRYQTWFLAIIALPLHTPDSWLHLKFGQVRQNRVSFSYAGIKIKVDKSSSPLFFRLDEPKKVRMVTVKGKLKGLPTPPKPAETEKDFPLRVGLVLQGNDPLSWLERLFAPGWLKKVLDVSPGVEVEKVVFFNISQTTEIGAKWPDPDMPFIEERVVSQVKVPGPFTLEQQVEPLPPALAIWIQADGDDTQSTFEIEITEINLLVDS